MISAGNIGGTKTLLALCEKEESSFQVKSKEKFVSADFNSLCSMIGEFLGDEKEIKRACFSVSGSVSGDKIELTNLPWTIDVNNITFSKLRK